MHANSGTNIRRNMTAIDLTCGEYNRLLCFEHVWEKNEEKALFGHGRYIAGRIPTLAILIGADRLCWE